MTKYKLKKKFITLEGYEILPQELEQVEDSEEETTLYRATVKTEGLIFAEDFGEEFVKTNKEFFEEIAEESKDILRWPNGAIMEIPDDTEEIFKVFPRDTRYTWDTYSGESCKEYCKISDSVFLFSQEAQEECEARNVRAKLMRRIKEIDRDNNLTNKGEYYLFKVSGGYVDYRSIDSDEINNNNIYMSRQSKDYMFSSEVSERERNLFLGIKSVK